MEVYLKRLELLIENRHKCSYAKWIVLGNHDLLCEFFYYLSAEDLISSSEVCRVFYLPAVFDYVWAPLCQRLWQDKVCISARAQSLKMLKNCKRAFYCSIRDSKREYITVEELSDASWSFRFKESAGEEWVGNCPWQKGNAASLVLFRSRNGNGVGGGLIRFLSSSTGMDPPPNHLDLVWQLGFEPSTNKHHSVSVRKKLAITNWRKCEGVGLRELKFSFDSDLLLEDDGGSATVDYEGGTRKSVRKGKGKNKKYLDQEFFEEDENNFMSSSSSSNSMVGHIHKPANPTTALPTLGDSVLIHINSVPAPLYLLSRSPTGNWGFVLQSCWGIYTSWTMPAKGTPESEQLAQHALLVDTSDQDEG